MKKNQSSLSVAIGVACVWMGTHFGPGAASGTQILVFWVRYGLWGAVAAVFAMCLLGYGIYCSAEFSRIYRTYNYADWTEAVWGKKWMVYLLDFSFVIVLLTAMGSSLNVIGTLVHNELGISYWIGVACVILIAALLCAYGERLVSLASSYMMYLIILVLAIVIISSMRSGKLHLGQAIENIRAGAVPGIRPSFPGAIWSGVIYASFQANVIGNISSVCRQLPDRKTTRLAAIIGVCGNVTMLVVMTLFFIASTTIPGHDVMDTAANPLPFYGVLNALDFGGVKIVYVVTVFFAVLSTVVGFCYGAISRYAKFYRKPEESTPLKDAALVAALLLVCSLTSRLGIVALVSTGNTILGYLNLPLLIFPAIVLAKRKISKNYLITHNVKTFGID
jgi:uncharacterized membrane protein YkvI